MYSVEVWIDVSPLRIKLGKTQKENMLVSELSSLKKGYFANQLFICNIVLVVRSSLAVQH